MGRIFTSGFEYNSTGSGDEFTNITNFTVVTSPVRSGVYAGRSLPAAGASTCRHNLAAADITAPVFYRFYVYIAVLPTATRIICAIASLAGANKISIQLTTSGTLILFNSEDSAQIGSASSALSTGVWYRVELSMDSTTISATAVDARLNGISFASGTPNLTTGQGRFVLGGSVADTNLDLYFDDIAINDASGSVQNSWPGAGQVIRLKPNAAGDANTFSTQGGGTAGSENNYTRVDEVTYDDASTRNGSNTLDQEDMFEVEASGLTAADTITCCVIEARRRNPTADAVTTAKLQVKKVSGGTIAQGDAITPNSNTWANSRFPTYTDPDGAAWTSTTLNTMQIGYKITVGGTNNIDFSTVSAIVDYVAGVAAAGGPANVLLLKAG